MQKWLAAILLLAASAQAEEQTFNTHKIVHIVGDINYTSGMRITKEMMEYDYEEGPIFVFIDSMGGHTDVGRQIISLMEAMKTRGDKFICMVTGDAHSMAFNILTHCDTRLANKKSKFIVHKTRYTLYAGRFVTARQLLRDAQVLLNDDKFFDPDNAKAMGLSKSAFDKFANKETRWTAKELLKRGYLHGYVTIDAGDKFIGPPAPQGR